MLLAGYTKEIKRAAACRPGYQPLYCIVHLHEDISDVFPYLNAVMGATGFTRNPPAMMLKSHGRQLALNQREITISPVADGAEAEEIMLWLQKRINDVWKKRAEIKPSFNSASSPQPMDVLRLLPKTNCGSCGLATCTLFAALVVTGQRSPEDCPALEEDRRLELAAYLKSFRPTNTL